MSKIIVIVGPTGVGKTKLSIKLAKLFNGEIINADSMQIYKGLDVGTAKVTKEEMKGIKHHLLDIKEVDEMYTVFDYQRDCRNKIKEIESKGKTPIIVGGTGLYIKAALYNYDLPKEDNNNQYEDLTNEELLTKCLSYNKELNIDINNRKRLIRCLNKLENETYTTTQNSELLYDAFFIGLTTDREELYERINNRVDEMIPNLIDEVKKYYDLNIRSKALMTGIGYKEIYEFFDNKKSFNEAILLVKQNSRKYAKRQYTWFNNQMDVTWFNVDYNNFDNTVNEVVNYLNSK